jgi:hypothetical protein
MLPLYQAVLNKEVTFPRFDSNKSARKYGSILCRGVHLGWIRQLGDKKRRSIEGTTESKPDCEYSVSRDMLHQDYSAN